MRYYFPNTSSENFSILPVRAEKKNQKTMVRRKNWLKHRYSWKRTVFLPFSVERSYSLTYGHIGSLKSSKYSFFYALVGANLSKSSGNGKIIFNA